MGAVVNVVLTSDHRTFDVRQGLTDQSNGGRITF